MSRGVYIICEGQTEEEFVNRILRPYLYRHKIYDVRAILIATSKGHKGGDIKYDRLRFNIERFLAKEDDIIVTTFIDFFRLKSDFPEFEAAKQIKDKLKRVDFLKRAIANSIEHPRFIPYIQLHEFEGLLFASKAGFEFLPDLKTSDFNSLVSAVEEKTNPEELNDGENTAPSKRLKRFIPGYDRNKPFFAGLIAEINTIEAILNKCVRFREWTDQIIIKFS